MKNKIDHKTATVIWYLISKLNGVLGKTHLQKMMFLADLLSAKNFQQQITVMEYKKYHYGPYTQDLDEYIKFLVNKKIIEERAFNFNSDPEKHYSRYYVLKPFTDKGLLIKEVGGSDKALLLDDIINSFGNLSLQEVLDVVYSLQETKRTDFNGPIELAKKIGNKNKESEEAPF